MISVTEIKGKSRARTGNWAWGASCGGWDGPPWEDDVQARMWRRPEINIVNIGEEHSRQRKQGEDMKVFQVKMYCNIQTFKGEYQGWWGVKEEEREGGEVRSKMGLYGFGEVAREQITEGLEVPFKEFSWTLERGGALARFWAEGC